MTKLQNDAFSLLFEAPVVIAMRCQAMGLALASGKPQDSAEIGRMIQEKVMATAEAGMAVQAEMIRQGIAACWQIAGGGRPTMTVAKMNRLSGKAAAPYAKRVRGNTRRLSKKTS